MNRISLENFLKEIKAVKFQESGSRGNEKTIILPYRFYPPNSKVTEKDLLLEGDLSQELSLKNSLCRIIDSETLEFWGDEKDQLVNVYIVNSSKNPDHYLREIKKKSDFYKVKEESKSSNWKYFAMVIRIHRLSGDYIIEEKNLTPDVINKIFG